jgi:hypothetical protein
MRGRVLTLKLLGAGIFLTTVASAQERSAPPGAVAVRPVQVREVRVDQPQSSRRHDQRPSFGTPRPVDPAFISRPIPRPQPNVNTPRHDGPRPQRRNRSFAFKPRFNVGHGIVVGYPIIYPYAYPYDPFSPAMAAPYNNAPPAPNTYSNVDSLDSRPMPGSVTARSTAPGAIACEASAPCGGVSFDITPDTAQVYVDGVFAGLVSDFEATSAPLLLAPGSHYVEIRLAGYRSASFDVTIAAGEVTPYQGTLERLRLQTP